MRSRRARAALLAAAALLSSCGGSGGTNTAPPLPPAAAPAFSPEAPLNFRDSLEVALATSTSGATIRYTLDGSTPGAASTVYAGPFTITTTTVVRAFAAALDAGDSAVAAATYTYRPVDLVVDDGTSAMTIGVVSDGTATGVLLNRFTPAPKDFPFALRTIRALISKATVLPLQVAVYADADGDPANGATLLLTTTVPSVAVYPAWTELQLPGAGIRLSGPGDVLVAVTTTGELACRGDATANPSQSWMGFWHATGSSPPALPFTGLFRPDRKLLIRASN